MLKELSILCSTEDTSLLTRPQQRVGGRPEIGREVSKLLSSYLAKETVAGHGDWI